MCKANKSDHINPILETALATSNIAFSTKFQLSASIPSGTAPQYLSDLLQPYTPARQLRSASDTRTFVTPRVTLRHSDSTSSFKAALKMHLFNNF